MAKHINTLACVQEYSRETGTTVASEFPLGARFLYETISTSGGPIVQESVSTGLTSSFKDYFFIPPSDFADLQFKDKAGKEISHTTIHSSPGGVSTQHLTVSSAMQMLLVEIVDENSKRIPHCALDMWTWTELDETVPHPFYTNRIDEASRSSRSFDSNYSLNLLKRKATADKNGVATLLIRPHSRMLALFYHPGYLRAQFELDLNDRALVPDRIRITMHNFGGKVAEESVCDSKGRAIAKEHFTIIPISDTAARRFDVRFGSIISTNSGKLSTEMLLPGHAYELELGGRSGNRSQFVAGSGNNIIIDYP